MKKLVFLKLELEVSLFLEGADRMEKTSNFEEINGHGRERET